MHSHAPEWPALLPPGHTCTCSAILEVAVLRPCGHIRDSLCRIIGQQAQGDHTLSIRTIGMNLSRLELSPCRLLSFRQLFLYAHRQLSYREMSSMGPYKGQLVPNTRAADTKKVYTVHQPLWHQPLLDAFASRSLPLCSSSRVHTQQEKNRGA